MSTPIINRRRHERFTLPAAYTPILVETKGASYEGHSYDISEGGVQFELDEAIVPGEQVWIAMTLPVIDDPDPVERTVAATGNIIWRDDSEPGPVRMAIAFTRFASEADRERLLRQLGARGLRRAA